MSYTVYAVKKGFASIMCEYPGVFQWLKKNENFGEQFSRTLEEFDFSSVLHQLSVYYNDRDDIMISNDLFIFENRFTKTISTMGVGKDCFVLSDLNEFPFLDWLKRSYSTLISIDSNDNCGVVK